MSDMNDKSDGVDRQFATLRAIEIPAPRPEARARAMAAAMAAYEARATVSGPAVKPSVTGSSPSLKIVSAEPILSMPSLSMPSPAKSASTPRPHWMRRRETLAIAASLAIVAIGLPALRDRMQPDGSGVATPQQSAGQTLARPETKEAPGGELAKVKLAEASEQTDKSVTVRRQDELKQVPAVALLMPELEPARKPVVVAPTTFVTVPRVAAPLAAAPPTGAPPALTADALRTLPPAAGAVANNPAAGNAPAKRAAPKEAAEKAADHTSLLDKSPDKQQASEDVAASRLRRVQPGQISSLLEQEIGDPANAGQPLAAAPKLSNERQTSLTDGKARQRSFSAAAIDAVWMKICGRDAATGSPACHVVAPRSGITGLFAFGFRFKPGDTEATLTLETASRAQNVEIWVDGRIRPTTFSPPQCSPDSCLSEARVARTALDEMAQSSAMQLRYGATSTAPQTWSVQLMGLAAALIGRPAAPDEARQRYAAMRRRYQMLVGQTGQDVRSIKDAALFTDRMLLLE